MARMYTTGRIKAADIILATPYNNEINQSVGELNGGLDQNNMPLESVDRDRLVPSVSTVITGPPYQETFVMPSQDYHISQYCDAGTGIILVGEWQIGWNKFEQGTGNDKTGFVLDFVSSEGMLKGEICVDMEMRISAYIYKYDTGAGFANICDMKDKHTGELGVFVNDTLVARTGPLYIACGRHSYVVPWSTPIGSGPCHVDVRWLVDFKNEYSTPIIGTLNFQTLDFSPYTAPLQFYNRLLWCRNEKR